ncbi:hypothetical protein [Pseudaestuariivita sp.]|uniref:hypothetical protein n=1 Tax=Pseudaestuariivita sp. TaxID=2211669 RepID=UPI0040582426
MRRLSLILAVMSVMAAAPAAHATTTAYTCKIKPISANWIPEVLFVGHKTGSKTAVASDPIILHYNDRKPMEVRVGRDRGNDVTFVWTHSMRAMQGHNLRVTYRTTITRGTGDVAMRVSFAGGGRSYSSRGTCEIKEVD